MATQIMIFNGESILIDDQYHVNWAEKGNAWQSDWIPANYHAVVYNDLPGPNEIQTKDPSTLVMTGNTTLSSTTDVVGSTTVGDLLTWSETRKDQITSAKMDYGNAVENAETKWVNDGNSLYDFHEANASATASYFDWTKTWADYDDYY